MGQPQTAQPASERTTVRRLAKRAVYDRDEIFAILDAGTIAHVGVTTDDGPIVLPMAYGRTDDDVYLHGSAANALLRAGDRTDVCVTVTLVDGLVVARTAFHNSMNYRSVVVRGPATRLDGPEKVDALRIISDHIVATWHLGRPASEVDIRQTLVLSVPLVEMTAKVRTGDPVDEPEDMGGPWWAGVVPLHRRWAAPIAAADLDRAVPTPAAILGLEGPAD